MVSNTEDPRVTGEHVRRVPGEGDVGDATLVGVVHNHPASTCRVRTVLDDTDPDVLALELPPLALPLYEQYAADGRTPPRFGGEMSAAVQAAAADRVVGIDGPSSAFVGRLLRNLAADAPSASTVRSVVRNLTSVTRQAVVCRLAASVAGRAGVRVEVDSPITHDCGRDDDPGEQARDERSAIQRARTTAEVFERSDTARVRDVTRNDHMADRLSALRREGDVVAVVGIAHLDPLIDRITG